MNYSVIRRRLLAWFDANQRQLPWRTSRDVYAIWVSEVMLQQTQVTTVIPFFLRFLKRFPTIELLAKANEQEVLQYWEGLGYYRRARHLHQAAQQVVNQFAGRFPIRPHDALSLPGLGRYTVGAILSQAFDQRLPIVDANVARVLCRLFAWLVPLEDSRTKAKLWELAEELLPTKRAGDHNQALMELGQTVCTVGEPSCLLCPLREQCQGRAQGLQATLPRRIKRVSTTVVQERAIVLRKGSRVLLCQRPTSAQRWASMWEFPTAPLQDDKPLLEEVAEQCVEQTGYELKAAIAYGSLNYTITRYQVTLHLVHALWKSGRLHRHCYAQLVWVTLTELEQYPLSIPQRRIARLLQDASV